MARVAIVGALVPSFLAIAPVKDNNFDVDGVKDCIKAARSVYALLGAAERPPPRDIERRAEAASEAFLRACPAPD